MNTEKIKRAINRILRYGFGYEIKKTEYLEDSTFSYHLAKLFKKLDICCVLDVGANEGGFGEFLRNNICYDGWLISFEPVRKLFDRLQIKTEKDPRWIAYNFALGSKIAEVEINVMKEHSFSSFLTPDHSVVTKFAEENKVDYKQVVTVKTLDSIIGMLRAKCFINNVYLKMDTQGYDMEVIKGAEETLPSILALQTELALRRTYRNMPGYLDVLQTLNEKGFDITGMYPVMRDASLSIIEFDCVMINNTLLSGVPLVNTVDSGVERVR
ncbi:MAG: FkbM family methyltransferase [Elusimicrobia bacterium]|nr:FkbM family methyltransferase [Elusimicrobiota bacterium]